jgi:ubiquinone biosynthesis monooxygenase Coq7
MSEALGLSPVIFPKYLERELRSDHAGETGAVYIYKGIIAVAKYRKNIELINFAENHGATEAEHLKLIELVLEKKYYSYLLGPWRIAGWLTGALPALFGPSSVYATIASVETFVEQHYQQQIDYLRKTDAYDDLLKLLLRCQSDEIHHKNEARSKIAKPMPIALRIWCSLVEHGSAIAVQLARRI